MSDRNRALCSLCPSINYLEVIRSNKVHFIANRRVLAYASLKFCSKPFTKQHDCHPAKSREASLGLSLESGFNILFPTDKRCRVGSNLGAHPVKIGVSERNAEKTAYLPYAVGFSFNHYQG